MSRKENIQFNELGHVHKNNVENAKIKIIVNYIVSTILCLATFYLASSILNGSNAFSSEINALISLFLAFIVFCIMGFIFGLIFKVRIPVSKVLLGDLIISLIVGGIVAIIVLQLYSGTMIPAEGIAAIFIVILIIVFIILLIISTVIFILSLFIFTLAHAALNNTGASMAAKNRKIGT